MKLLDWVSSYKVNHNQNENLNKIAKSFVQGSFK